MTSDILSYAGKRVIVTGAASGMGEATARMVAGLGAEVHALDLNQPRVPVASFTPTDLRDPRRIEAAVDAIGRPVHALFNCAGLPQTFPPLDVMTVNLLGMRHLTELVAQGMEAGGAIATLSSAGGLMWQSHIDQIKELLALTDQPAARSWCEANIDTGDLAYAFSKECIIVYTMQRSYELAQRGIRINCTSPGPTTTAMYPHFEQAMGKQYMDDFPRPLGRNSTPEEQAYALVFLNSAGASYITGVNLFTDGGFTGALHTGQLDITKLIPASA